MAAYYRQAVNQNLKWLNPMQCRCLIWLWWLCILGCVLKSLFYPVQLSSKLDIVAKSSKVAAVALQAAPQRIPKILLSKQQDFKAPNINTFLNESNHMASSLYFPFQFTDDQRLNQTRTSLSDPVYTVVKEVS